MASAFYDSCVLFTATDLGVFTCLAQTGQAGLDTLAARLNANPRGLRLLLDACAALGLLIKTGETYDNSPTSDAYLVAGRPGDLSQAIRYNRDVYAAWGHLRELALTGQPVEAPSLHLGEDADRTRTFVLSMHHRALAIGRALIPMLALAGRRRLLDLAGGPGTYAVLCAQANPALHCTVLDLPAVASIANGLIREQGLHERVQTLPGDYHHTPFPDNQDVVTIFGALHQESPAAIIDILKRARASLVPGGTIHIMDLMTDATHTQPKFSALFAVNMALTTHNGWVFSSAELTDWLTQAGFLNVSIQPLPPPMPHWLATATCPR